MLKIPLPMKSQSKNSLKTQLLVQEISSNWWDPLGAWKPELEKSKKPYHPTQKQKNQRNPSPSLYAEKNNFGGIREAVQNPQETEVKLEYWTKEQKNQKNKMHARPSQKKNTITNEKPIQKFPQNLAISLGNFLELVRKPISIGSLSQQNKSKIGKKNITHKTTSTKTPITNKNFLKTQSLGNFLGSL